MFGNKKRRVYLDYAASTPVCREARRAMMAALEFCGNPSALHREGKEAGRSLAASRGGIASFLGVRAREIVFTSGGTESNTLAILGTAKRLERIHRTLKGTKWLVSAIEHPSVLETFAEVERLGGTVSHLEPDERGVVTGDALTRALTPETVCVSIGWANSETGVVQPLRALGQKLREHERAAGTRVIFHSDAGAAPLYLQSTVHTLGVDLMTLDSGKAYGPQGIALLYVAGGAEPHPVLYGGGQERGMRPGGERVALAAGFAAALERLPKRRTLEARRVQSLRDTLRDGVLRMFPGALVNTPSGHSLPHMLNVSIPDISSEYLVLALDHAGIALSTKSACREGEESGSHVVRSLGGENWRAESTIRFSLGETTVRSDVSRTLRALEEVKKRLPTRAFERTKQDRV